MDEQRAALLEKLIQNHTLMLETLSALADAQHMITQVLLMPMLAGDGDSDGQTIQ